MKPASIPQFITLQLPGGTVTVEVDINQPRIELLAKKAAHSRGQKSVNGPVAVRVISYQTSETLRQHVEKQGVDFASFAAHCIANCYTGATELTKAASLPLFRSPINPAAIGRLIAEIRQSAASHE